MTSNEARCFRQPIKNRLDKLKHVYNMARQFYCIPFFSCEFVANLPRDPVNAFSDIYTPATQLGGVYWIQPVCPSVCPSVCLLTFRVRPVSSTVQDEVFPYLVQMLIIIRGCVACYIFFIIWKFRILSIFWKFSALTLKKNLQLSMDSFHI